MFSEVLRAHRAIEVDDLDEMTEVLAVCQGARWPRGRRIGLTTGSGGQAELILDRRRARCGSTCRRCRRLTARRRERVIGAVTGDGNPLDYWGNGDFRTNLAACAVACWAPAMRMTRSSIAAMRTTISRSASPSAYWNTPASLAQAARRATSRTT